MATRLVCFRAFGSDHYVNPQLAAMAERAGVDLATTDTMAQIEFLQRGCVECRERQRCIAWLQSRAPAGYEEFCPIAHNLNAFLMRAGPWEPGTAGNRDATEAEAQAAGETTSRPTPPLQTRSVINSDVAPHSVRPHARRDMAIAVSLALALGFGAGDLWGGRAPSERANLVEEVAGYHQIYSRETNHLVEVAAAQSAQLTSWLGERLQRPIAVPDLTPYGLHFAGGRMLVIDEGPVAELMYTRANGLPIAICVTRFEGKPWPLSLDKRGELRVATWAKDAYAYVVVGELEDAEARALARIVASQI